jgi:hypothetical protein
MASARRRSHGDSERGQLPPEQHCPRCTALLASMRTALELLDGQLYHSAARELRSELSKSPMHTKPMAEYEGEFSNARCVEHQCRKCGGTAATREQWNSHCGGYTDYKFTCEFCGAVTWTEGPDA